MTTSLSHGETCSRQSDVRVVDIVAVGGESLLQLGPVARLPAWLGRSHGPSSCQSEHSLCTWCRCLRVPLQGDKMPIATTLQYGGRSRSGRAADSKLYCFYTTPGCTLYMQSTLSLYLCKGVTCMCIPIEWLLCTPSYPTLFDWEIRYEVKATFEPNHWFVNGYLPSECVVIYILQVEVPGMGEYCRVHLSPADPLGYSHCCRWCGETSWSVKIKSITGNDATEGSMYMHITSRGLICRYLYVHSRLFTSNLWYFSNEIHNTLMRFIQHKDVHRVVLGFIITFCLPSSC